MNLHSIKTFLQGSTFLIPWLLMIVAIFAAYQFFNKESTPAGLITEAKPAKEVIHVERVIEIPKIVYVYPDSAKDKVPEKIKEDKHEKLIASTKVDPDDYPHTISTVLNIETGNVTTYDHKDPLPWFASNNKSEAFIAYGLKNGSLQGRIGIDQNIFQVKRVKLGATATVDTDSDWFAGAYLKYGW